VLFLLPGAPPEVIDAAYRALVKLNHPDLLPEPQRAAGNEKMKLLNTAYAQLTAGRKAS
jgi:curved DNA-binding protein CbpA